MGWTYRATDTYPKERQIFHNAGLGGSGSSSYIDDIMARDRDANTDWRTAAGDGTLEERRYSCQDWRHDVCAVLTDTGKLVESVKYFSYGTPFGSPAGDTDFNGTWDATDEAAITGPYSIEKDTDLDGSVGAGDITWANAIAGGYQTLGLAKLTSTAVANRKGYCGYESLSELAGSKQLARNRVLDPELGRWLRRDPLGYVDGMSLYGYVTDQPLTDIDPHGLAYQGCLSGCGPLPGVIALWNERAAFCADICSRAGTGGAVGACFYGNPIICYCPNRPLKNAC